MCGYLHALVWVVAVSMLTVTSRKALGWNKTKNVENTSDTLI